jgi:hypothetical protein
MAVAAVTPRVRTIVICDDISASLTDTGIFTLERVRLQLAASSFPCRAALRLYLLLSSPRKGRHSGKVLVVHERSEKPVRYIEFFANFEEGRDLLPLYLNLGDCVFPEPGLFTFQVYFSARDGAEVLKGEHPFFVVLREE